MDPDRVLHDAAWIHFQVGQWNDVLEELGALASRLVSFLQGRQQHLLTGLSIGIHPDRCERGLRRINAQMSGNWPPRDEFLGRMAGR